MRQAEDAVYSVPNGEASSRRGYLLMKIRHKFPARGQIRQIDCEQKVFSRINLRSLAGLILDIRFLCGWNPEKSRDLSISSYDG